MEPVQPLSADAYRGVDSLSIGRLLTDFVCYAVVTLAAVQAPGPWRYLALLAGPVLIAGTELVSQRRRHGPAPDGAPSVPLRRLTCEIAVSLLLAALTLWLGWPVALSLLVAAPAVLALLMRLTQPR
ncbi:hypothetical protein [Actinomyces urogenitalis]|uniref:hypothetical protein n=1 Tax=Actinomyces urogenitalis TaxID=103621 RepID=UPI00242E033C|nr:hypothetical protein [Actinomyces urogenitalis]MCI7457104.1 hypothetical protein [Actinomyces urogenitalis]